MLLEIAFHHYLYFHVLNLRTLLNVAPPGSLGAANKSEWSNKVIFKQFLEHFISNVQLSVEKPVLLLMDNLESYVNISIIELVKRLGIILMTFHPHTIHKMQPFDCDVFGPFKIFHNSAMNNWMISPGNTGKPVAVYDITYLVGQAYHCAFVPNHIVNSFKCTRFFPFTENVFTEIDFLAANATDRLIVDTETTVFNDCIEVESAPGNLPSTSFIVSPEMIRPHLKAKFRKTTSTKRRKVKSRIITDTPEMNILHSKSNNKQRQKLSSTQIKTMAKQIIFNQQSDTSLNDESSDEIDFGVNVLDNKSEKSDIVSGNFI